MTGAAVSEQVGADREAHEQERERGQQEGDELPHDVERLARPLAQPVGAAGVAQHEPDDDGRDDPRLVERGPRRGTSRTRRSPRSRPRAGGRPRAASGARRPTPRRGRSPTLTTTVTTNTTTPSARVTGSEIAREGDREQHDAGAVVEQALGLDDGREPGRRPQPLEQGHDRDRVRGRDHRPEQERLREVEARSSCGTTSATTAGGDEHAGRGEHRDRPERLAQLRGGRSCTTPRTRGPGAGPRGSAPG